MDASSCLTPGFSPFCLESVKTEGFEKELELKSADSGRPAWKMVCKKSWAPAPLLVQHKPFLHLISLELHGATEIYFNIGLLEVSQPRLPSASWTHAESKGAIPPEGMVVDGTRMNNSHPFRQILGLNLQQFRILDAFTKIFVHATEQNH